jgi:hypothetical protein
MPHEGGARPGLRVSPLLGGDGAAAITMATTGAANDGLCGFRGERILTAMNLPQTAGMWRCLRRHRDRDEVTRKREQQQKPGGQTMHAGLRILEAYQLKDGQSKNEAVLSWWKPPMPLVEEPCEAAGAGEIRGILRLRHTLRFADRVSPLRMTCGRLSHAIKCFRLCRGSWPTTSGHRRTENASR